MFVFHEIFEIIDEIRIEHFRANTNGLVEDILEKKNCLYFHCITEEFKKKLFKKFIRISDKNKKTILQIPKHPKDALIAGGIPKGIDEEIPKDNFKEIFEEVS